MEVGVSGRATARLAPGDLLVGRHRLLREVARGPRTALWQAEDEVLARAVAVRVLTDPAPDSLDADTVPLDGPFLAAALRAGRVSDPRVASVYDAGEEDGVPVVVREWVEGEPLSHVLLAGPLQPQQVASVGMEIAAALTAAHAREVGHGALHPGDVVLTPGGVKLTDLEVTAALEGHPVPEDPAERGALDARSLGAVLYAASTGCWPFGAAHGLPSAPETDGHVCTPHQIRAAVPRSLDTVITAALDGGYADPGAVSVDLAALASGVPVPRALQTPESPGQDELGVSAHLLDLEPDLAPDPPVLRRAPLLVLVLVLVAVGGWTTGLVTGNLTAPSRGQPAGPVAAGPDINVIRPVSVTDFDPPPGDGEEKPAEARFATDGQAATIWTTDTYRSRPDLGGLKPGVGILLDLGEPAVLTTVELVLESAGGAVEVRGGLVEPTAGDDLALLARLDHPEQEAEVHLSGAEQVQHVLIWFTSLPPRGSGYGTGVREVEFRGTR